MKKKFFIYSLPRSGSSWLSQFLSQPGSYCYHEPLADGGWQLMLEKIDARPEKVVGAIDTSAHQRPQTYLGECEYYVLYRDISDVLASLRIKGYTMDLYAEKKKLDDVAREHNAIALNYKWFNDIGYLRNVWESIVGLPFDAERTEYLMEMNVQRRFASVRARVSHAAS